MLITNPITDSSATSEGEAAMESLLAAADAQASYRLIEPLTKRESEILNALSHGLSNIEIADRFRIAEATVKTHVSRLFSKLGVKRRGQAIALARKMKLIN